MFLLIMLTYDETFFERPTGTPRVATWWRFNERRLIMKIYIYYIEGPPIQNTKIFPVTAL